MSNPLDNLEENNKKVTFEEFKDKCNVEQVGFDTSEDGIEMSRNGDGIINFAIGNKTREALFEKLKEQGILPLVIMGTKVELNLARNVKLLVNYSEEDKKELWT